jgi:hypothetical protein
MGSDEFDESDLPKSKATIIRKLPPAISNLARSPFRIFAFGAVSRTSSIEFHLALLTNVRQRWSGTFVSGCRSAYEESTLHAIILMLDMMFPKREHCKPANKNGGAITPPL